MEKERLVQIKEEINNISLKEIKNQEFREELSKLHISLGDILSLIKSKNRPFNLRIGGDNDRTTSPTA